MAPSKIISIETENPSRKWRQGEILDHILQTEHISTHAKIFYKRFLSNNSIQTRYLGLDSLNVVNTEIADEAIVRFQKTATKIGTTAVRKLIERRGLNSGQINGLVVTTCTGYLCPGLTSYVSQTLKLKDSLFALDLAGIGCGAALPALRAADQYLMAHPNSRVIVLCVEICSAALSWGNEIDLVLSNAIFGDGAAACLLSNCPGEEGFEILGYESILWPEFRDDLRFKTKGSRLCNVINKNVPAIASEAVKTVRDSLVNRFGDSFRHYAVHPGGGKILDEIGEALDLKDESLQSSRDILRDYGNMSSPSVLFVLRDIMQKNTFQEGERAALFSFGAGFTAFGTLLKYRR